MSTAHRYLPSYTVEDYRQWEGDWELWQGIPVSMSPSPFGRHQKIASRLLIEFQNAIDGQSCDAIALAEIDWIISRDTVVRPDIVVLCGDAPERHVESAPAIAAEILSDSSKQRDREAKLDLYQEHGVGNYLILDPGDNSIQNFRRNSVGVFELQDSNGVLELKFCEDCSLSVSVERLFR